MNKFLTALFATLVLCPSLAMAQSRIIYGNDDRLDYSKAPAPMQRLADSVVSFWDKDYIRDVNGNKILLTVSFEKGMGLCPGETFAEQPIGAFCSGTLVGEDLVLTAGHCITDQASCDKARMVFGFNDKMLDKGVPLNDTVTGYAVDPKEVYSCSKIIKRHLGKQHTSTVGMIWDYIMFKHDKVAPDYALIQLDRKVSGHNPLPVERVAKLKEDDKIFVIGHPVGLPVKVAGGAKIRNNKPKNFYLTDLDTFGGNSGSAVFSQDTGKIVGILVRGSTDFVDTDKGCKKQNRVEQDYGKGEAVNRLKPVLSSIPLLPGEKAVAPQSDEEVEVESVAAPELNNAGKSNKKIASPF